WLNPMSAATCAPSIARLAQSADSLLVDRETRPLDDPAVLAGYRDLAACLAPVNAGAGIGVTCVGTTPAAVSVSGTQADSTRVIVTWFSAVVPLTASVERRVEAGDWRSVAQVAAGRDGLILFSDFDVAAGGHYQYRLAVDVGGRVETFAPLT